MGLEFKKKKIAAKKSTTRQIAFGFAMIILAGTLLLSLPIANRSGHGDPLSALFTATSATCVTGLVVADTYQNWTIFGQLVILCMIQVGGLGFMTIGAYISVLLKKRIGLKERERLQESVNTLEIAGVVRLVKKIVQGALCIEGLGAVLLAFRFVPRFGAARGIYFAVFHAISAFCNGGFDLMGAIPLALAQATAPAYHASAGTSGKGHASWLDPPSRLYSTVTSMARVRGRSGEKVSSPVPWNRPRALAKVMASPSG